LNSILAKVLKINAGSVKYMTIFAMPEIVTLGTSELRTAKYPNIIMIKIGVVIAIIVSI
jgi:hypothetical protein